MSLHVSMLGSPLQAQDPVQANLTVSKPCSDRPGMPPEEFSYCSGNLPFSVTLPTEPLPITLTYNPQVEPGSDLKTQRPNFGFGPGWLPDFEGLIVTAGSAKLALLRSDGGLEVYRKRSGESVWRSDSYPRNRAYIESASAADNCSVYQLRMPGDFKESIVTFTQPVCSKPEWLMSSVGDHGRTHLTIDRATDGAVTVLKDDYGRAIFLDSSGGRYRGLIDATPGDGRTYVFQYNGRGELSAIVLPDGTSWHFEYDSLGLHLLTGVTDPFGRSTARGYDSRGTILAATDEVGSTTYQYSPSVKISTAAHTIEIIHNASGAWTRIIEDGRVQTEVKRGIYNRIEEISNLLGERTVYQYQGNAAIADPYPDPAAIMPAAIVDAFGKKTVYTYNSRYEPVSISYDNARIATTYNWTTNTYTVAGKSMPVRQISTMRFSSGNGSSYSTTYQYDGAGYLRGMEESETSITTYGYNDAGEIRSMTSPDGSVMSAASVGAPDITTVTLNGLTTSISQQYAIDRTKVSMAQPNGVTQDFEATFRRNEISSAVESSAGRISSTTAVAITSNSRSEAISKATFDLRAQSRVASIMDMIINPALAADPAGPCQTTSSCERLPSGEEKCTKSCNCCK